MRRLVFVAIGAFFVIAGVLPLQPTFVVSAVSEGERLSMYSKPSVVRIVDGAAGHVVTTTHDGEEKAKQALFWQMVQQIAKAMGKDPRSLNANFIDQYSNLQSFKLYHHVIIPDGSAFPFEIKQYGAPTGESNDQGKDVAIIKIEVKNAPILKLSDSDKVQLQDHVTVVGYPGAADTFNSGLLDSKSALEATINDGKISARKQASSGAPILQTNASATHGNSGGPVLSDGNEVIGLLTFRGDTVNGQEVSGFSFIVPSNTVMEYVKSAGATNTEGPTDNLYREGLDLYWDQHYSEAIPKFEEVKRLFPQHSEVDRLVQSSQQAKAEGKEKSSFPLWIVGVVLIVLVFIVVIIGVGLAILFMARRRGKSKRASAAGSPGMAAGPAASARPSPAQASYSPSPANYSPSPSTGKASPPSSARHVAAVDQGMTVDLSRTVAIVPDGDTSPIDYGSIKFVSGSLAGQHFPIAPDGAYVGRDASLAQIVIPDPRISKRHLWIGVREGKVIITDQGSRNGTFINDPKSKRVTESLLNPGDTVILGESDVARFEYQN